VCGVTGYIVLLYRALYVISDSLVPNIARAYHGTPVPFLLAAVHAFPIVLVA